MPRVAKERRLRRRARKARQRARWRRWGETAAQLLRWQLDQPALFPELLTKRPYAPDDVGVKGWDY